jgi:hypothetical protein
MVAPQIDHSKSNGRMRLFGVLQRNLGLFNYSLLCRRFFVFCFPLTIVDFTVKYVVAFGGLLLECFRQA